MKVNTHSNLFDTIAEPYAWFYNFQCKHYKHVIKAMALKPNSKILDLGAGTGAMASLLNDDHDILAVDGSKAMVKVMKRLNPNMKVEHLDITQTLPYANKQFDVVLTSFVLHGLKAKDRLHVLSEMKRVADVVIVYDYYGKRHFFTDIVEFIEQGDYFNFMKQFKGEFRCFFPEHVIIPINSGSALYIGGFNEDILIAQQDAK
ncbi:MAG: class I SAM-dependent methyltransferase [Trichloromonadaceae bacterium]